MKNAYAVCYNTLLVFKSRESAIKCFKQCAETCDTASHEYSRYSHIIFDLMTSNVGLDNVDNNVWEIHYFDNIGNKKETEIIEQQDYKKVIEKIEKEF